MAGLASKIIRRSLFNFNSCRYFSCTSLRLEKVTLDGVHRHKPSVGEKKMLVRAKMYASVEEVPDTISMTQMTKAKDIWRIRTNIKMIIVIAICSVIMIYHGKYMKKQGDTVTRVTNKWIADLQEEGRKERMAVETAKGKDT